MGDECTGQHQEEEEEEEEFTTLIFHDSRFKVNKKKLITKSHYFKCLFSDNFNDSQNKEHVINYDIASSTFQNFIEWIHDNEHVVVANCYSIKASMKKYESDHLTDLLNLLHLGVLFAIDDLISDITDIIVLHWLHSQHLIDIWLKAKELGVNVLRDICFAECLDSFAVLNPTTLVNLRINDFMELIENVNLRASKQFIYNIAANWFQIGLHGHKFKANRREINLSVPRKSKFMHYIVGKRRENVGSRTEYILFEDGDQLSKLTELEGFAKDIVGMQVIGRGFSIYSIGGEYGFGTGHFNLIIWRYCLISKKWYYFARLRRPRRHMVVAFLDNRLLVVGGVGTCRVKLSSVETLNISTGDWSNVADVPEQFTEIVPHCVMKNKLFLLKSTLHIFSLQSCEWQSVTLLSIPMPVRETNVDWKCGVTIFTCFYEKPMETTGKFCTRISNTQNRIYSECLTLYNKDESVQVTQLERQFMSDIGVINISNKYCKSSHRRLSQSHDEMESDKKELTLVPRLGNIYTIDPKTLYAKYALFE